MVQVGGEQLVKAFGVALKTMKQGEKVDLRIKPECEPPSPSLTFQHSPNSDHLTGMALAQVGSCQVAKTIGALETMQALPQFQALSVRIPTSISFAASPFQARRALSP